MEVNNLDCISAEIHPNASTIGSITGLAIFDVIIIVSNVILIIAVCKTPKLHTVINMFITALAFSDLFIGVLVLPFSIFTTIKFWIFGRIWCSIWRGIVIITSTASLWSFCTISIVRYIAATSVMNFNQIVSRKTAKILITCIWIASFIISLPPVIIWDNVGSCPYNCEIFDSPKHMDYTLVCAFIPIFIMLFCYCRIYMVAKAAAKSRKKGAHASLVSNNTRKEELILRIHCGQNNVLSASRTTDQNKNLIITSGGFLNQIRRKLKIEKQKAGRTLTIIVGTYTICWALFLITYAIHIHKLADITYIARITPFLGICNAAMNPWIFWIFCEDIGIAMNAVLQSWLCIKPVASALELQTYV